MRASLAICVLLACVSARAVDDESNEKEQPITRDQLNALMKHPTEPDYDPLRPMSGKWIRCQNSRLDRFSSTDRSHFTHTVIETSDQECKTIVSEERSMYECSSVDKKNLSCLVVKRESRKISPLPGGTKPAWIPSPVSADEPKVKLSFAGARSSKKRKKPSDKLTLTLSNQTFELEAKD